MIKNRSNIIIIGNLHKNPSSLSFLNKFLSIMDPLTEKIFVISGEVPPQFHARIIFVETNFEPHKETSFILRIIKYIINQMKSIPNLLKLLMEDEVDFLFFLAPSPLLMLMSKLFGKTIIRYEGGSISKQMIHENTSFFKRKFLTYPLEKIPRFLSNKIIIESEASLEFQNLGSYKNKIVISPLYVDENHFSYKKNIKNRDKVIGFIGNLEKNKGFDKFINSIVSIKDYLIKKKITVIIIGSGPLLKLGQKLVKINGLSEIVEFKGWITNERLSNYLNDMILLVFPSLSEGLPNTILEAMACGTPVLAASIGGIPDIIQDGETGFILKDHSKDCIARNIIRALAFSNTDLIVCNALKLIKEIYSYDAAIKRYQSILEDCES